MTDSDSSPKQRVLIVDDHPIVRHGLQQMLNQEADLIVCGEAGSAAEALEKINELKPDVAIVDISLETSNGIELTKSICGTDQELPVLVLSMHDESLYAERALRAGANGYVMKQEVAETVVKAVRTVVQGDLYVSEAIASRMLRDFLEGKRGGRGRVGLENLSDRELEVFELIGRGKPARAIAEMLHLSVKTVETHRGHIKRKLKLRNAAELMQHAVNWVQSEMGGGASPR
jgi:DNA-binding NarL/FixJ family response regulator